MPGAQSFAQLPSTSAAANFSGDKQSGAASLVETWVDKTSESHASAKKSRMLTAADKLAPRYDDDALTTNSTSFWVDSRQQQQHQQHNQSESQQQQQHSTVNELDEESDSANKNSEILMQIRKIMGKLELSDAEDEEDEHEEAVDGQTTNGDENSNETEASRDFEFKLGKIWDKCKDEVKSSARL